MILPPYARLLQINRRWAFMAQKRIKRTDQEWFELIKGCKTSSLKAKTWCEQHESQQRHWITIPTVFARMAIRSRKKLHRLFRMKSMKLSAWIFHKIYPAQKQRLQLWTRSLSIPWCSTLMSKGYLWTSPMMRRKRPDHHKNPPCVAEPVLGDLFRVSKCCLITGRTNMQRSTASWRSSGMLFRWTFMQTPCIFSAAGRPIGSKLCIMINMVSYCFICGWMPDAFSGRTVRPKRGCLLGRNIGGWWKGSPLTSLELCVLCRKGISKLDLWKRKTENLRQIQMFGFFKIHFPSAFRPNISPEILCGFYDWFSSGFSGRRSGCHNFLP